MHQVVHSQLAVAQIYSATLAGVGVVMASSSDAISSVVVRSSDATSFSSVLSTAYYMV